MTVAALELALIGLILASALVTLLLRDVLAAIIVFGAYSFGMAMLWVVFRAPDVGLTEAVVGSGVMTPLLLLAIAKMGPEDPEDVLVNVDLRALAGVTVLVAVLAFTVLSLPEVGNPASPTNQHVAPYYLENAYEETGFENVVTAILVSYRGLDTFGEVTVVFAALVAVLAVLRREVLV